MSTRYEAITLREDHHLRKTLPYVVIDNFFCGWAIAYHFNGETAKTHANLLNSQENYKNSSINANLRIVLGEKEYNRRMKRAK